MKSPARESGTLCFLYVVSFSQSELFISQLWETYKLYMIIFTCIETIKAMNLFFIFIKFDVSKS